jgi:hypothetical protein
VNIGDFSKKECYDARGVMTKYVDSDGKWFDLYEPNEEMVSNMVFND